MCFFLDRFLKAFSFVCLLSMTALPAFASDCDGHLQPSRQLYKNKKAKLEEKLHIPLVALIEQSNPAFSVQERYLRLTKVLFWSNEELADEAVDVLGVIFEESISQRSYLPFENDTPFFFLSLFQLNHAAIEQNVKPGWLVYTTLQFLSVFLRDAKVEDDLNWTAPAKKYVPMVEKETLKLLSHIVEKITSGWPCRYLIGDLIGDLAKNNHNPEFKELLKKYQNKQTEINKALSEKFNGLVKKHFRWKKLDKNKLEALIETHAFVQGQLGRDNYTEIGLKNMAEYQNAQIIDLLTKENAFSLEDVIKVLEKVIFAD